MNKAAFDVFSAPIFARMRPMNRLKTPARLLALFACSLALHLCGTWILPLVDRDEPRFAEAAREMRQRGDWVLPTFNDQPRYDKPPLTYWLQSARSPFSAKTNSPPGFIPRSARR